MFYKPSKSTIKYFFEFLFKLLSHFLRELDLHKNRLNTIRKEGSFLKKYIDSKPIEIKHNMKTDAIKANEKYSILKKNTIIHERLNILKKKTTPIKNKKDSQNGFTPAHHSLVNRKREAKRIEEENKKTYKRMHVWLKKFLSSYNSFKYFQRINFLL